MKFKIEPGNTGYFLYVEIDGKWKLLGFKFTLIGVKISAWRYKRHFENAGEFEI